MTAYAVDATTLNERERRFLELARKYYDANMDWLEFESFAFGMRSPLFAKDRSHRKIVEHPLYVVLKEMWLDLGVRQGKVAPDQPDEVADAPRGETPGRG